MIKLFKELEKQVKNKPVELLVFTDNKRRSIGYKREALLQMAKGDYLAFIDDDDEVYPNYIEEMLKGAESGRDVISIKQHVIINDSNKFVVTFSIDNGNEEAYEINGVWQDIKRSPFHVCGWKSSIAKKYHFPDSGYGEDWKWANQVIKEVKTEYKNEKIICCYRWNEETSEADNKRSVKK